jgi:hypothetical protein
LKLNLVLLALTIHVSAQAVVPQTMTRVLEELEDQTGYIGALILAAPDPMSGDIKTMT